MKTDKIQHKNYFYTQNTKRWLLFTEKSAQKIFSNDMMQKESFSVIESHEIDAVLCLARDKYKNFDRNK